MHDAVRRINQEFIEKRYNRKFIDAMIRKEIAESQGLQDAIKHGVHLLSKWLSGDYYESKNLRLEAVKHLDLKKLVTDIFVGISYFKHPELFTSVTAQLAARLDFSDRADAITTMAEMVAVLTETDVFDINKEGKYDSLYVVSNISFDAELTQFIENSEYLPPMVCTPMPLRSNRNGAYLTFNDSLILGSGNHHEGDICLDTLNLMNAVELKLDTEFICKFEEVPTYDVITPKQKKMWKEYKVQNYRFYCMLADFGNQFHLTHKVDKRGRAYAQGYHVTTQGTAFKKACIDLYNEEVVTGI